MQIRDNVSCFILVITSLLTTNTVFGQVNHSNAGHSSRSEYTNIGSGKAKITGGTDTWSTKSSVVFTARNVPASAVVNGVIYVMGGDAGPTFGVTTNEAYDPVANTWTTKSSAGFTGRGNLAAAAVNGVIYAMGGLAVCNGCQLNTNEAYDPISNTWSTKSSSGFTARSDLAAVAVNGVIYALGGNNCGAISPCGLNTNEAYDPVANTWSTKSSTGFTGRFAFGAAAVNGVIYALGGSNNASTNEAYNPVANTWSTKSSVGFTSRLYFAAAAVNGVIYALGGAVPGSGTTMNKNEAYDPVANSWATKSSTGFTARDYLTAAAVNGVIYALGGNDGIVGNLNEAYDARVTPNVWITKSSSGFTARAGLAAVAVHGVIYAFGGSDVSYLNTNEAYDPVTDTWTTKSSAGFTARAYLMGASVNGVIYAMGGWKSGGIVNTNEAYDPVTNTWSTKSSTGFTGRIFAGVAAVNGRIYVMGGNNGARLNTNEVYDPVANTWSTKSSAGFAARNSFASTTVNGVIYAMGGVDNSGTVNSNETYDPVSNTWATKSSAGFTARYCLASAAVNGIIYTLGGQTGIVNWCNIHEAFDPVSNTWSTKSSSGFSVRAQLAAAEVHGVIYALGGWNNGAPLNTNEAFVVGAAPTGTISSVSASVFDTLTCQNSAKDTVWLHNTGGDDLTITQADILGPNSSELSVISPASFPITIAPGDSVRVITDLTTSVPGVKRDTLSLVNDDPTVGHNPWRIVLKGQKEIATLSLKDSTINMTLHSGVVADTFTVDRNTGTCPDTITSVARVSGVSWITCTSPTGIKTVDTNKTFALDTARIQFHIKSPRDTGMFSARFKIHWEPCGQDSFVTVNVLLRSGIDSVIPTVFIDSLLCDSQYCVKYMVFNTGNDSLALDSLRLRGPDSLQFGPITPSTPRKIAAKDSAFYTLCFTPKIPGSFSSVLRVASNDSMKINPAVTTLSARKDISDFSILPGLLLFGDVCIGDRPCLPLSVPNIGSVGDTITSITVGTGGGAFSLGTMSLPRLIVVGSAAPVTVCFSPPAKGSYAATFVVRTEPCARSRSFSVTGRGVHVDVSPLTAQVDMGDVRGGKCVDTAVGFAVSGNSYIDADASNITVSQSGTALSVIAYSSTLPHRFQPGDTLGMTIHYCPVCDSSLAARIDISATGLCPAIASMKVIGHGNCSSLSINLRAVTFGTALCNIVDSVKTVGLSNLGTLSLDVNCALSGANAADFALDLPTAFRLAAGASQSIAIHFAGTARGVHTATLIITSNDPAHPADTLLVTARVDSAGLAGAPAVIDFGDLPSCLVPKDTILILHNTGTVTDTVNAFTALNFQIISAMPRVVAPGNYDTISVRFDPTVFDNVAGEDLVFTSMPCNIADTVHLKGKADKYTFVPNNVDFGNTQVGDTVCLTVSIVNHNARSVRVRTITVTPVGEINAQSPALPFTIAAHDSIVVNVCYVPLDSTQMRTALSAFVDSPCSDTLVCTLIGHGIKSDLVVTPRTVDFGTLDVCTVKEDSVQVCNRGTLAIVVSALSLGGTDAATFAVVNPPALPLTLAPGACQWIVVKCDTGLRGEGTWRAALTITPQDNTLPSQTVNFQVVRHAPVLAVPASVDFGQVKTGTWKDSTIVLHNTGSLPLCIDALNSATQFAIITKTLPLTLAPGDSLVLKIRFTPLADSSYVISIAARISCPCPEVKLISLFGSGESNPLCTSTATLALDTIGARVGDVVDFPIHLVAQSNIAVCGASDFMYTIRYRGSLLAAMPPQGRDSAEWHIIDSVRGTRTDTAGALGTLRFTATLGDTDATPIIMQTFAWTNGAVSTTIVNGELHIQNICPAGGKRLVNAAGTFTLAQNAPNPFTGETTFEFETIERSRTRLIVEDILGRTVAVVVDDELIPGRYRKTINMQSLPSGVYRALLESAAMRGAVTIIKNR